MQEESNGSTCAREEMVLRWKRRSQSLSVQGWGTAKNPLCYCILYHLLLGKGSMNRGLIQGYPSMSWMSPQWAQGILRLPLLEELLGTAYEMGDWKQHFCHSAFSREMGPLSILRTRERRYICKCPCSLSSVVWFLSLLGRCVLTGRHQAWKSKCYFFCLHVVNFWLLGFVVEKFEGLADLG